MHSQQKFQVGYAEIVLRGGLTMKIAVIGSGHVGSALGERWAKGGHQVVYGSRDPHGEKVQAVVRAAGPNASATTAAQAVANADVVLLATPWSAAEETVRGLGNSLSGKVLIDANNPMGPGGLAVSGNTSAAEQIAGWARGARVVKAFNTTGSGNMLDPNYDSQPVTMFICGDDENAKKMAAQLAQELGFDVTDAGPLTMARYLEPLAALWISLAYGRGMGPNIAFRLMKR
jgi:8-hydroxy-5-deazaflavin:NADPH oxidoreductase